jgi:tetratricopeptide (TPR) repeat protein
MTLGRTDEAMKHFQEAIKIQPHFANAHYRLSILLKQKGLNEKALYHLNEAVKINPEFGSLKN